MPPNENPADWMCRAELINQHLFKSAMGEKILTHVFFLTFNEHQWPKILYDLPNGCLMMFKIQVAIVEFDDVWWCCSCCNCMQLLHDDLVWFIQWLYSTFWEPRPPSGLLAPRMDVLCGEVDPAYSRRPVFDTNWAVKGVVSTCFNHVSTCFIQTCGYTWMITWVVWLL